MSAESLTVEPIAPIEPIELAAPSQAISAGCCLPGVMSRLADAQAQAAATLLKALADPARLQILDVLSQYSGLVCVCDLEGVVGLPDPVTGQRPRQPTISHHLKVLRQAGLVRYAKRGQWAYYAVVRERVEAARALLAGLIGG